MSETAIAAGDRMLLCTDGLTRMVTDGGLAAALDRFRGDPQGACDHLIATANERRPDTCRHSRRSIVKSR